MGLTPFDLSQAEKSQLDGTNKLLVTLKHYYIKSVSQGQKSAAGQRGVHKMIDWC